MQKNAAIPLKTLQVVEYRDRTYGQWKAIWEYSINANSGLKGAWLESERKTEAILSILGEGAGPEGRDTVGSEIRTMTENLAVGSFIDAHAQGYMEGCSDVEGFLNDVALDLGMKHVAMKWTMYVALFFAAGTWFLNLT